MAKKPTTVPAQIDYVPSVENAMLFINDAMDSKGLTPGYSVYTDSEGSTLHVVAEMKGALKARFSIADANKIDLENLTNRVAEALKD